MKVIYGTGRIKTAFKNPVVTIGVFDGVHRGHQSLLRRVVSEAKRLKGTSVVLTFHPHPSHILSPHKELPRLISLPERLRLLERAGIDICIVEKFSKDFSRIRAEDFINRYLVAKLNSKKIFVGEDFVFGKDQQSGMRFSAKIRAVPAKKVSGRIVSSTLIRRLLSHGQLKQAAKLLSRPLLVRGKVGKGSGKGKVFGFPTANIKNYAGILMPRGVYAVKVYIKKRSFFGMAFIGARPAFVTQDRRVYLEVNIFSFNRNIRGREIGVEFLKKIRDEKKFTTASSLIRQLKSDLKAAKRLIPLLSPHQ